MGKKWKPLFSTQKYWEVDCKRKNEFFNPERRLFSTWSSLYSKPNYHPRSKVECRLIVFLKTAVETNGANGDVFQKSRPKIQWRQIVTQKRTEREWRKQSPGIRWVGIASDMTVLHRDEQQGTRWAHLALAGQQHAGFPVVSHVIG